MSGAVIMCASSPDEREIINPPSGALLGDGVTFQGFPGTESTCDDCDDLLNEAVNPSFR